MSVIIAPSLLAADFAHLAGAANAVDGAADWLHVDVMDNHFVPNLTIGLPVVTSLRRATDLPFDVHLMIEAPERWAPAYAEGGAYNVTFHAEAAEDPIELAKTLRAVRPGGVVGYVTCSPHPVETRVGVTEACRRSPYPVDFVDARTLLPAEMAGLGAGPSVQLWPHRHGTDAMFIALLRRLT